MLLSSCPSMIIIQLVSSRSAMMGRNIHHKETNFPSFVLSHHTDKSPDFWGKIQDFVLFWDGKSDKVCALCSVYKAFIIFVSGIQCVSLVKRKLLNYSTFGAGWPYHKSARGAKSFELVRATFHFLSQERVAMCRRIWPKLCSTNYTKMQIYLGIIGQNIVLKIRFFLDRLCSQ